MSLAVENRLVPGGNDDRPRKTPNGHDSEEVYGGGVGGAGGGVGGVGGAARFLQGGHHATPRPSSGVVAEGSDFSSCSFAPKSAVFPASWPAVHPQPPAPMPGIYHPYMPQPHLGGPGEGGGGGGGRYVRSWIEPFASFPSSPGNGGGGNSNVSAASAAAAAAAAAAATTSIASNGAGGGSSSARHYGIVKPESGAAAAAAAGPVGPSPSSSSATVSSSSSSSSCSSESPSKRTECAPSREPSGVNGPEYTCNSFLAEPREKAAAAAAANSEQRFFSPGCGRRSCSHQQYHHQQQQQRQYRHPGQASVWLQPQCQPQQRSEGGEASAAT
uniref:homeobox protein Hox-D9 n=1 Tax=Podarcis muralis TaxID=64176 RepID=UPI00109F11A5|nr:homeobox protein Hox-D9 [Podarcis muralis]